MRRCVRTENVVRCPSCGKAYEVFNMMVGDQSRCPTCLDKLAEEVEENLRGYEDEKLQREVEAGLHDDPGFYYASRADREPSAKELDNE